ncbi:MAG: ABC transporter substrate-binding protein, partial [Candidatus Thorarchaeota archaeon]
MGCRSRITIFASVCVIIIVMPLAIPLLTAAQPQPGGHLKSGPFVKKIIYKVIEDPSQQFLALQNDDIDIMADLLDLRYLAAFGLYDIEVGQRLRNGYGYLTINCAKYPFNITAFRRALAFALDKEEISNDIWDGFSYPQDSAIPAINPFSIEGTIPYNYYKANVTHGNHLLDTAGFTMNSTTGFRDAPNGQPFRVEVLCPPTSSISIEVANMTAQTLHNLYIDAYSIGDTWWNYPLNAVFVDKDYDIAFLGTSFPNFDVDWLAYEFWSENIDQPYINIPRFNNSIFDTSRELLLHSIDFDAVYAASARMQEILIYECPIIVCYENVVFTAFRNDRFEGFQNDASNGIASWWTNYKVHLKSSVNGPIGGTIRWGTGLDVDSFNFMTSSDQYSWRINMMLWESLLRQDPNGVDVLWLAESFTAETHEDNPNVPINHTIFTFDILKNATWSDGTPITAYDVAFTLNYYHDSPGNPFGSELTEMLLAFATSPYKVIVEFSSESYWHLHTVGYKPILPKHLFEEIGVNGWSFWNPLPPEESMITSGPFNVSDRTEGETIELSRNPNYFFEVESPDSQLNPADSTGNATEPSVTNPIFGFLGGISVLNLAITIP